MKFYLALLALVGLSESNGCTLTLGGLGNRLDLNNDNNGQNRGQGQNGRIVHGGVSRPAHGATGTNYACFPIVNQAVQVRPAPQVVVARPSNVLITITPHQQAFTQTTQYRAPTQSYVQSSFFPTIDYYPWGNSVASVGPQAAYTAPVATTSTPVVGTAPVTQAPVVATSTPVLTTPAAVADVTEPVAVTPAFNATYVAPTVQPQLNATLVAPVLPVVEAQPVTPVLNATYEAPVLTPDTPVAAPELTLADSPVLNATLVDTPVVTPAPVDQGSWNYTYTATTTATDLPAVNSSYLFNQGTDAGNLTSTEVPTLAATAPVTPVATDDLSNINFDNFDFANFNLDDLLTAAPVTAAAANATTPA